MRLPRLRWSDPEPDDLRQAQGWRGPSLIIATLFLNFTFCDMYGLSLAGAGSPFAHAVVIGTAALLLTTMFFVGPALALQSEGRPLLSLIEDSFGSIPRVILQGFIVVFLAFWMSELVVVSTLWLPAPARTPPQALVGLCVAAVLAFLFFTGLQSPQTSVRQALFTDKFSLAILIAALIRVHDGWRTIPTGFPPQVISVPQLWIQFSGLTLYAGPLAVLAAGLCAQTASRKNIVRIALAGMAGPIFGVLVLSLAIGVATFHSGFYQPSGNPTIGMALTSQMSHRAIPGRMLIVGITTFGAIRFGARSLATVGPNRESPRWRWLFLGAMVAFISWLCLDFFTKGSPQASAIAATSIAMVGAVLTADFIFGRRPAAARRVDWVASSALLSGAVVAFFTSAPYEGRTDDWWLTWPYPSYAAAFIVSIFGRAIQKLF
jgi:hypothetical protein